MLGRDECTDLHHARVVPGDLLPGDLYAHPVLSPDGRTVAVGNSTQGTWWLTVRDMADGGLVATASRNPR